uniref:Letm1 RBD domain-containing protein n=1 Tax=Strigamia maritima TaxID=126957 RepID=T1JM96_STRMM
SQNFFKDSREYLRIRKEVNQGTKITDLRSREIEIYYEMPKELIRVLPIIVVATLPFTNYFIFPLIYLFPRQLLSTHFWTMEQKVDFALIYHKKRLSNNQSVFRYLQDSIKDLPNPKILENCQQIFHKIGSGVHPTAEEILLAKEAFGLNPYKLASLSPGHITSLCWMHGLSVVGFRKRRLKNHAEMIQYLDTVLKREDIRKLNADDMRKACFLRGINPISMQRDDIIKYLEQWMKVTDHVNSENISLLLHCPILLAYNQPTNWSLTH